MKKLFLLSISLLVSVAMLFTACKKDEANNNGNNDSEAVYVDLGLPSGTKWKSANETGGNNGFYTYDEAMSKFGDKLPTLGQCYELIDNCTWEWQNDGYKVTGTNGKSIFLPSAGWGDCDGNVYFVGSQGGYWSSSTYSSEKVWSLYMYNPGGGDMYIDDRCGFHSVRLVEKQIR